VRRTAEWANDRLGNPAALLHSRAVTRFAPALLLSVLLASPAISQPSSLAPASKAKLDKRIAKVVAKGDGKTQETAYKVRSVAEEYLILDYLGLAPQAQALVAGKKTFDRIEAKDPRTGTTHTIWFDISSFYGREF
jgi:hypothetical protein